MRGNTRFLLAVAAPVDGAIALPRASWVMIAARAPFVLPIGTAQRL
jgi:hypothetical protein